MNLQLTDRELLDAVTDQRNRLHDELATAQAAARRLIAENELLRKQGEQGARSTAGPDDKA